MRDPLDRESLIADEHSHRAAPAPAEPGSAADAVPPPNRPALGWALGLAVFGVAVLIAAWAALYLTWPFGQDQSAFAWVADVIRAGGLPYQDAWEVKGPLVYYMVAIANAAFGRNFWGIRLFDLLVLAAGMVPLYLVARTFASRAFALLGPALFLLWYAALNFENTAQPDGWAGVFLTGAAAALITRGRRPNTAAAMLAGALIGACTLFKPTYGMFLALPFLFAWWREQDSRSRVVRFWAASAAGFVLPLLVAAAWFAAKGALDSWFEVQGIWLGTVYTGLGLPWSARINKTLQVVASGKFATALPFALAGLEIVRRRDAASAALLGAWTVLPVINVLLQGKPWPYLWLPIYAPLAVLTVVGMQGMLAPVLGARRTEWSGLGPLLLALAAVLLVSAMLPPVNWLLDSRSLLRGGPAAAAYDAEAFGQHGRGDESLAAIAESIRRRTEPDDRVLSWGMTPTVNFLSGRSSPSRFGVDLPLESGGGHPLQRAYRRELMAALHATPPKFVVLDIPQCAAPVSDHGIEDFPELVGFLRQNYQLETEVGYRREGQPGCVRVLRASNETAGKR